MNILHIASNYPPEIGGPAASVPYLAKEQAKLTHGTQSFSEDDNVKIYRCGKIEGKIGSISAAIKKSIKMGLLGRKIIRENKIDIIHAHDPNISAITKIIIDPCNKIPSLVKYSGDLAWETLGLKSTKYIQNPDKFWTRVPTKIILLVEKLIFSRFSKIIAQNKYQKNILLEHLKAKEDKISTIPNGIKKYEYTPKEIASAKKEFPKGTKICSVARLVPWKGIDNLIKAMKEIDATYIIFGDGPYRNYLEKLTKKEHLEKKVIFFGKIPHEKVQLYIKTCDLLVVPSLYEPFGIVILDGFAANITVIATNTGGIPELINEDCLFERSNLQEIKEKIKYALKNKSKIIEAQNEYLETYSWKTIAKKTQKTYFSITKKNKLKGFI